MARMNVSVKGINRTTTHEGGKAIIPNAVTQLERSVLACMLWEDTFYESGTPIVERIDHLCSLNTVPTIVDIARRAKQDMYLRHAPLWLVKHLLSRAAEVNRQGISLANLISDIITRPDDLTELLSMYWAKGKKPLSAQLKKGLAQAFKKFDEYQLAKYNRGGAVKLRDVLFLCHAKPTTPEQEELFKKLIANTLTTPDTWEVAISAAKGDNDAAKAEWERLLQDNRLGALALLRNLSNMLRVGVPLKLIRSALRARKDWPRISPFQFLQAFRAAPELLSELETAMLKSCEGMPRLCGRTLLLIDASGSMDASLSARGTTTRLDAAVGVGIVVREVCEDATVVMYGTNSKQVPPYHGMALGDYIRNTYNRTEAGYGTQTGRALRKHKSSEYDRVLVITDEQSWDALPLGGEKNYIINVGSDRPSIAYGKYISITGWSPNIINYIAKREG